MILDTAALVAILYREPEAAAFAQLIYDAEVSRISVAKPSGYIGRVRPACELSIRRQTLYPIRWR